jgi:hypothetical protein
MNGSIENPELHTSLIGFAFLLSAPDTVHRFECGLPLVHARMSPLHVANLLHMEEIGGEQDVERRA